MEYTNIRLGMRIEIHYYTIDQVSSVHIQYRSGIEYTNTHAVDQVQNIQTRFKIRNRVYKQGMQTQYRLGISIKTLKMRYRVYKHAVDQVQGYTNTRFCIV